MKLDDKLKQVLCRKGIFFADALVEFLVETSLGSLRAVGRLGEGVDTDVVGGLKDRLTTLTDEEIDQAVLRTGVDRVVVELALGQIRRWGKTQTLAERLNSGDFFVADLTLEHDTSDESLPGWSEFREMTLRDVHQALTGGRMTDVRVRVTFDKIDD
jgi:hypothetical protein